MGESNVKNLPQSTRPRGHPEKVGDCKSDGMDTQQDTGQIKVVFGRPEQVASGQSLVLLPGISQLLILTRSVSENPSLAVMTAEIYLGVLVRFGGQAGRTL